ncbi:uncharacterized protein LOC126425063 isoform X2 [Schistocerca serialis cubense]|uniref:uncharacterized protein LOC126425063 isoform X2 n=1 Tax=Schistocerca serialis cubense TaxID=2023355 RepID=UPI00214F3027|nr:uncharacterized protein LOC126425063 isoform X2 [Schistocerca serialis cubense]
MTACVTGCRVVGQLGKPVPVLARDASHRTLSAHPLLQAARSSTMGLVPKFSMGCFCCTLKTGSFVTAVFLLVGSCVQVGYYGFLVTHMNPQKMCVRFETVIVTVRPPVRRSYDYDYYDNGIYNPRQAGGGRSHWPRNHWGRRGWFGGYLGFPFFPSYPRYQAETRSYLRPCIRNYMPFDADNGVLDFDLRGQFDKSILYFNIGIWVATMAATPLLMAGVYKESATMVTAWLVAEALLLTVATASTLATATLMFHVIPVQIPIVTLLNMAIHLGINVYYWMVVVNFRRQLTTKEEDEEDNDDKRVEQVIV